MKNSIIVSILIIFGLSFAFATENDSTTVSRYEKLYALQMEQEVKISYITENAEFLKSKTARKVADLRSDFNKFHDEVLLPCLKNERSMTNDQKESWRKLKERAQDLVDEIKSRRPVGKYGDTSKTESKAMKKLNKKRAKNCGVAKANQQYHKQR